MLREGMTNNLDYQFVEDVGNVVFHKNVNGVAPMKPVFTHESANDSSHESRR
jgi:hypothetical protein